MNSKQRKSFKKSQREHPTEIDFLADIIYFLNEEGKRDWIKRVGEEEYEILRRKLESSDLGRRAKLKTIGKLGGRHFKPNMRQVLKVLLRGFRRLAELEPLVLTVDVSLAQRRLVHEAKIVASGFDKIIAESRSAYLANLQKMEQINSGEGYKALRSSLHSSAREIRGYLRIISVKAAVLLQDIREQTLSIDPNVEVKLKKISKIEIKGLGHMIDMIIGIVQESLDEFGKPISS